MRVISNQELEMVSGGDLWEIISGFFHHLLLIDGSSVQSIVITGHSMSDMEKFAYDIEQVRIALPQCAITITINPTVSFGEIKGTITAVPSLTGTASVTSSTKGFQYACPPIKPGQHNSNSTGIAAI